MELKVERRCLRVESGRFWPEQDVAFIEDTLGLKKDGDYVKLVRKNASGLSCPAYLVTEKEHEKNL